MSRRVGSSTALLASLAVCPGALASPFDFLGVGSVNAALAGSGSASIGGAAAALLNPAALTLRSDCDLDLAYAAMVPSLRADLVDPGSLGNLRPFQRTDAAGAFDATATLAALERAFSNASDVGRLDGFTLMGTLPFRRVIPALGREVTFGALVFLPGTATEVVRVEGVTPDEPVWPWLGSRLHRLMAALSVGADLWPGRVAIGAGVLVLADIAGRVDSVAPIAVFNPADPAHPAPPAPSVATFRQRLATDAAPVVGVLVRPADFLSFGLSYRGPMDLSLDFDVQAGVSFDLGGVPIQAELPYHLRAHFFHLPAEMTFAASGRPWPWLRLDADLTVAFTRSAASRLPITEFTLDPSAIGPDGELVALSALGSFRATSAPAPRVRTRTIAVPKVGIEARPLPWLAVLAGYAYHPSPFLADQEYANLTMDSGYHRLGLGLAADLPDPTGTFRRPLHLSAHVAAVVLNRRYHRVGRLDASGSSLAAGVVRTSGHGLGGGVTLGFRF